MIVKENYVTPCQNHQDLMRPRLFYSLSWLYLTNCHKKKHLKNCYSVFFFETKSISISVWKRESQRNNTNKFFFINKSCHSQGIVGQKSRCAKRTSRNLCVHHENEFWSPQSTPLDQAPQVMQISQFLFSRSKKLLAIDELQKTIQ